MLTPTRLTKHKRLALAALLPALLATGTGLRAHAQTTARNWVVNVGGEAEFVKGENGQVPTWEFMRFYPDHLTIDAGDTVTWKLKTMELHDVLFLPPGGKLPPFEMPEGGDSKRLIANPLAAFPQGGKSFDGSALTGSGLLQMGPGQTQEYSLTFSKPGEYDYLCAVHSGTTPDGKIVGMLGHLSVQAAGSPYPMDQAQVDAAAAAALAKDAEAAKAADAKAAAAPAAKSNPDGSSTYFVNIGYSSGSMDWMRFGPSELSIKAGDSVTFSNVAPNTPHTVTFVSGGKEPDLILAEPQAGGPPKLVLNPVALAPAGGNTYSGQGYFNSGWLTGAMNDGPHSYTLKFDKPGRYEFICILHDQMGMSGYVNVTAK